MYPIVIFDALRVNIRDADSRMVKNKAVYVALGVSRDGLREVLGLWIADNEGAKFWLSVMNELKNIRHCRSDQWRDMAHRPGCPDRRCGRPQGLP
jgi:transposase-like protein